METTMDMRYPVKITPDDNGTFMVTFPDVPEAITYGDTRAEAIANAQDALLTIFDAFVKDRRDIPAPSRVTGPSVTVPALDAAKLLLYQAMRVAKVNKTELASRLKWHGPQVDRILKMRHGSQLEHVESALAAVNKRLVIGVEDLTTTGWTAAPRARARHRATARRRSAVTTAKRAHAHDRNR